MSSRLDTLLTKIEQQLEAGVLGLDRCMGRARKIVRDINEERYEVPACFMGNESGTNEYREVLPDSQLGNFCFFWLMDPMKYKSTESHVKGRITQPLAIIFWFDMRKVTNSAPFYDTESLKEDIIDCLNSLMLPSGRLVITKVYEQESNIYKEFTTDETINQYLMYPYAGFRFEGELIFDEPC